MSISDDVFAAIQMIGGAERNDISEATGHTPQQVSNAMTALRKADRIENIGQKWFATGEPEQQPAGRDTREVVAAQIAQEAVVESDGGGLDNASTPDYIAAFCLLQELLGGNMDDTAAIAIAHDRVVVQSNGVRYDIPTGSNDSVIQFFNSLNWLSEQAIP